MGLRNMRKRKRVVFLNIRTRINKTRRVKSVSSQSAVVGTEKGGGECEN